MYLFGLSVAPAILISLFVYLKDHKMNREPLSHLLVSFLLGAICSLPAVYIEIFGGRLLSQYVETGFIQTVLQAFVVIAFTEEYCKYFMLRRYAYDQKAFDEPYDGIVYSVMVSMGFASVENIGYVYQHGAETGILRMFLSVPAHASFAVIMGYFVGLAKFKPALAFTLRTTGIFGAVLFHGSYDSFLFLGHNGVISAYASKGLLVFGAFTSYFISIRLSFLAIQKHRLISKQLHEHTITLDELEEEIEQPVPAPVPEVVLSENKREELKAPPM